ncbi:MAG: hypothetical protein APR54_10145 [Candidatus Cloacimonas sp. SDB]|nr:MAG: hypothetical protein APR54_10145 [Candidatus Cloacimonas sp. SDB]
MIEKYISINECSDFIDNFNKFYYFTKNYISGDYNEFKWIIISLYMTLQSIFVLSLRNDVEENVLKCKSKKKQINNLKYVFKLEYNVPEKDLVNIDIVKNIINLHPHFIILENVPKTVKILNDNGINIDGEKLISIYENELTQLKSFNELYKMMKDKDNFHYYGSNEIPERLYIDETIKIIQKYRNKFIHFRPTNWGIILNGYNKIIIDSLKLIEYIISETNDLIIYDDIIKDNKTIGKIEKIRALLCN